MIRSKPLRIEDFIVFIPIYVVKSHRLVTYLKQIPLEVVVTKLLLIHKYKHLFEYNLNKKTSTGSSSSSSDVDAFTIMLNSLCSKLEVNKPSIW